MKFPSQSLLVYTAHASTTALQRPIVEKYLLSLSKLPLRFENNPDVLWIDEEKSIGIDAVRNIQSWIMEKPYSQKWKLVVLFRADSLTTEAQNALLKILEEPPKFAHMLLITSHAYMLLPTIQSRCLQLILRTSEIEKDTTSIVSLPSTLSEALSKAEEMSKDRGEAMMYCETLLLSKKAELESFPSEQRISQLKHIQKAMHLLKKNVQSKLALEQMFFSLLH